MKQIVGSVFLAATVVACNTNVMPTTGLGVNPCLEGQWKSSKYCASGPLKAAFLNKPSLYLSDISEDLLNGRLRLPLQAQALLSQSDQIPDDAFVEFFVDGRSVGQVPAGDIAGLSEFFLQLTERLSPGQHEAVAMLKAANGSLIAESNLINFVMPEVPLKEEAAIALLQPWGSHAVMAGEEVSLRAEAFIPSELNGAVIEFYNGRKLLGKGRKQSDGTWLLDWDTSEMKPGVYPITAVIKDGNGKELTRSQIADVVITEAKAKDILGLSLLNLSGLRSAQVGTVIPLSGVLQLPNTFKKPGQKIRFYANGLLVGEASVSKEGHYRLDWETDGLKSGDYTLKAELVDAGGKVLASSNVVKIDLIGNGTVAKPAVRLSDLPAKAFPGTILNLRAGVDLPAGLKPPQARVEFTANGRVIGKGILQPDGSWVLDWDTSSEPEGDVEIQAILYGPSGQLASSNLGKVNLSNRSETTITQSTGNISAPPGTKIPLKASVQVSQAELDNGAYVAFRHKGTVLGKGVQQSDGSWEYDWDTSGKSLGDYPIEAVLISGSGATLAQSNMAEITLSQQTQNKITLTSKDQSAPVGSTLPLIAEISTASNLSDARVTFYSNGELLGNGVRQSDGSWRLDWSSGSKPAGNYPIQAVLTDSTGKRLAQSNLGSVTLTRSSSASILLARPDDGSRYTKGSQITLESMIEVSPAQESAGVKVEFYREGVYLGNGQDLGSGKYGLTWNSSGQGGKYHDIQSVLKTLSGDVLAESAVHQIEFYSNSGSGSNINLQLDLVNPEIADNVRVLQGEVYTFRANPSGHKINPNYSSRVFFYVDGVEVGEGTEEADGSYTFDWDSSGRPLGSHNVTAKLQLSSALQAHSELGQIEVMENSIVLDAPVDGATRALGEDILLQATPELSDAQKAAGAEVEFLIDGSVVGTGTEQLDGSWQFDWDSSSEIVGTVAVTARAVLNGNVLTTSTAADLNLIDNAISLTSPTDGRGFDVGETTTVSASVQLSAYQVAAGYQIRFKDDSGSTIQDVNPVLSSGTTYTASVSNVSVGNSADSAYNFTAVILDENGSETSDSDTHTVQVFDIAVDVTSPADESGYQLGTSVTITGTADEVPSGGSVRFVLKKGSTTVGTFPASNTGGDSYSSASNAWNTNGAGMGSGDYTVVTEVLDQFNNVVAISDANDIEVVNASATVTGPKDGSAVQVNDSRTVTGTGVNVPGGGSVRFLITAPGGGTSTISASNTTGDNYASAADAWMPGITGDYTIQTQVLDANGAVVVTSNAHDVEVVNASVSIVTPADGSTLTMGTQQHIQGTAANIPSGGSVQFLVKDKNSGSVVATIPGSSAGGNNYDSSSDWNTSNARLGDHTLETQILDANGDLVLASSTHTVTLSPKTPDSLDSPVDNSLYFQEESPMPVVFTPEDLNGTPLSVSQTNGSTIEFYNTDFSNTDQLIGTGTRQADGSWSYTWDVSASSGVLPGNHDLIAKLKDPAGNVLVTTPVNSVRIYPYPRVVFIIDGNSKKVYDTYTGPAFPGLPTGTRVSIFPSSFKTVALAKHPSSGEFYYIEEGKNTTVKLAKYDPRTKTETILATIAIGGTSIIRLAFDPATNDLYASGGKKVYRVNQTTGAFTEIALSGTGMSTLNSNSSSGDIAFDPDGIMYLGSKKKLFRITITGNTGDVVNAGSVATSGSITSTGFDGEPNRILLVDTKGKLWSVPLNATTGFVDGALTLLEQYTDHTSGDMTSAHTGAAL